MLAISQFVFMLPTIEVVEGKRLQSSCQKHGLRGDLQVVAIEVIQDGVDMAEAQVGEHIRADVVLLLVSWGVSHQ